MTPRIHFYKLLLLSLFALLSFAFSVHAEQDPQSKLTPEQDARYEELIYGLRCPTCQGLSVKESEAGFSVQIRKKVAELVLEGLSNQEVKDYFVKRYGVWILRAPPKTGFNLILWILPGAVLIFGLGFLFLRSKKWVKTPDSPQKSGEEKLASNTEEELTEAELKQLHRDQNRFDQS